jgi:hypothetical protein
VIVPTTPFIPTPLPSDIWRINQGVLNFLGGMQADVMFPNTTECYNRMRNMYFLDFERLMYNLLDTILPSIASMQTNDLQVALNLAIPSPPFPPEIDTPDKATAYITAQITAQITTIMGKTVSYYT